MSFLEHSWAEEREDLVAWPCLGWPRVPACSRLSGELWNPSPPSGGGFQPAEPPCVPQVPPRPHVPHAGSPVTVFGRGRGVGGKGRATRERRCGAVARGLPGDRWLGAAPGETELLNCENKEANQLLRPIEST